MPLEIEIGEQNGIVIIHLAKLTGLSHAQINSDLVEWGIMLMVAENNKDLKTLLHTISLDMEDNERLKRLSKAVNHLWNYNQTKKIKK